MAADTLLTKTFVLLLCLMNGNLSTCETQNCYQALADCDSDSRCSQKLKIYAKECETIVDTYNIKQNVSRYPCSKSCVKAIKSLRQTVKGNALWKCDCYLDGHCLMLKTRTEKCLAIANGTYRKRTGCTLALYRCMKDSKCREAQIDFLAKCTKLFTLTACTNQCLCSQKRLFTLPVGRPLRDCECDGSGTEELYCLGLRAHAKNMDCSWKKRRTRRRLKKKRCKRCRQRRGDRCGRRVQKKKD